MGLAQSAATHCKRGHPFDFANTHIEPSGARTCRACRRIRQKRTPVPKAARVIVVRPDGLEFTADTLARFWAKVDKTDSCWIWTGQHDHGFGYGRFRVAHVGRKARVHRIAYELVVGPIPEGLVIDHLCRNPICVNPAHMEPVTSAENTRRGAAFRRMSQNVDHRLAPPSVVGPAGAALGHRAPAPSSKGSL